MQRKLPNFSADPFDKSIPLLKNVHPMQVYTPFPPNESQQHDHLSRRLSTPSTRLRTLALSRDSRLAIATQSNISILHPQKVLSHLYRPLQQSATLDPVVRITQSVRVPSVGHELIYNLPFRAKRKNFILGGGDVVSLTWCSYGIIFVCGRGGVYRVASGREWGCVLGTPNATFLPVRDAIFAETGVVSDVVCVKCVTFEEEQFMVLGRKSRVEVYVLQDENPEWRRIVRTGYVLTVDAAERVTPDGAKVLLAAGGDGIVTLHELSNSCREETLVWKMEGVRRLQQVNTVSLTCTTLRAELCLAISASNGFVIVDLTERGVKSVHTVEEAHQNVRFVSACIVCVDGSVTTGGLDGTVRNWRLESSTAGSAAHCDILQTAHEREELVKSVVSTTNGFGVFVLTSSRRANQEVRDVEDATLPKFGANARTTMVSLYVLPRTNIDLIESAIVCVLNKLETPSYYNRSICLWDIELFLAKLDCKTSGLLERLKDRFDDMVKLHEKREGQKMAYYQRAKVVLWLARLLPRVSGDDEHTKQESDTRTELRNSLLCTHYDQSLAKFLAEGDVEKTSNMERKALERMCQFVSVCKVRFSLHTTDMKSRVVEVRELLAPFIEAGESATTQCPVCATGVPLVADAHEPATFYCSAGDVFTRCVRTGLPVTGVLPLVCVSCDSRSNNLEPFKWLASEKCPLCNSEMQQSSGEPF